MIGLFEFLWHGCWHHWGETKQYKVVDIDGINIGFAMIQQCKKCGYAKRTDLYQLTFK